MVEIKWERNYIVCTGSHLDKGSRELINLETLFVIP